MPCKSEEQSAVTGIPYARCMIKACGNNAFSVRRELSIRYSVTVTAQREQQLTISRVPYTGGVITAGGDNAPAIRREASEPHLTLMSRANTYQGTARCVSNPSCMIHDS